MDINATLLGQFITFSIFIWFTMKFVWPPITKAMHEREKKIAAGLEAAEHGRRELEMATHKAANIIRDAKLEANQIVEQANLHGAKLIEEAKQTAKKEGQRIVEMAQGDIDRQVAQAKEGLKQQLARLAVAGAEKIIQRNLNSDVHNDLLDELAAEI